MEVEVNQRQERDYQEQVKAHQNQEERATFRIGTIWYFFGIKICQAPTIATAIAALFPLLYGFCYGMLKGEQWCAAGRTEFPLGLLDLIEKISNQGGKQYQHYQHHHEDGSYFP